MVGVPSPLGAGPGFDAYDEFVPEHQPRPGEFLDGHDVFGGRRHLAFHRLTRALFEERTVYDMTFDYNLARLNLDPRHPDAGYRYAEKRGAQGDGIADRAGTIDGADGTAADGERVLRAEFTPTTAFCPQSHALTKGSFRAWNALADRHEYDLVSVRVAPMHRQAGAINDQLRGLEETFRETGERATVDGETGSNPMERAMRDESEARSE